MAVFIPARCWSQTREKGARRFAAQLRHSLQSASLPHDETRFEARFGRIFVNVGLHGAEVLGTADEAVEVIGLPEGIQGAEAGLVDQTARNAFPALERVGEGVAARKASRARSQSSRRSCGSESESDEDRHLAPLPMRQFVARLFDVSSRMNVADACVVA